ncbi:YHYH domain-containing protein [Clostridium sp. UBA7503]|uniref:YHYH domain-containing protein n=1 Tax=Clostridium sp. UBA7503 TaxID=1946377 RepID=UPI0032169A8F
MEKKIKRIVCILVVLLSLSQTSYAHSGRTDSNGGHKDNKNASGLGGYHYHHGLGPHLHPGGVCELVGGGDNNTPVSSPKGGRDNSTAVSQPKSYYDDGYNDGYAGKESNSSSKSKKGYSSGYNDGVNKLKSEKDQAYNTGYDDGREGKNSSESSQGEKLKKSYSDGYTKGRNEYIENNKEIYKNYGIEDAAATKEKRTLENSLGQAIVESYNKAYDEKIQEIKNEYNEHGYKYYLGKEEYKIQNFESNKLEYWFKEGYDKAEADMKEAIKVAYDKGVNGEKIELKEEYGNYSQEINESYTLGNKKRTTRNMIAGGAFVTVVSGVGVVVIKKRKKK